MLVSKYAPSGKSKATQRVAIAQRVTAIPGLAGQGSSPTQRGYTVLHSNIVSQITLAVGKYVATKKLELASAAQLQPQPLDFYQSAWWLGSAYQGILNTMQGTAQTVVLPTFVACYSPSELVMLLVSEAVMSPSGPSEYYVYKFYWGERACVYKGRTFLLAI